MQTNALGLLVELCWREIPEHYAHIALGAWQVMPNHFHGLLRIVRSGGKGLGEVLNMFKGSVTREWRRSQVVGSLHGGKEQVWAPNYYDVICFDAEELAIRERYIRANPRWWALRDVPRGIIKKSRCKGNKALLREAGSRRALRVSRKAGKAEVAALQSELAGYDGVVCSTFFSSGERCAWRSCKRERRGSFGCSPWRCPKRFLADGRMPFWTGGRFGFRPFRMSSRRRPVQAAHRRTGGWNAGPIPSGWSSTGRARASL
ncbi:hypothetical protein SCARR_03857 [Pontiella sulfatireligans]|uniref:Transposase IS200-like domain-containing protein n=2 Tax=Pontiella sulfatireligans TaxID=2750658 RepID=A0A6C2UNC4_9BACT|nr:hypothetical protein SCARR_03857 [Pontiella sulfatireligans]